MNAEGIISTNKNVVINSVLISKLDIQCSLFDILNVESLTFNN